MSRVITNWLMVFLAGGLFAPTVRGETSLTWQDCVRLTAEHNPSLVASQARLDASEAGIKMARSSLFPQLALGASANRSYRSGAEDETQSSYNAAVSVDQSLYSGGKNRAAVRTAESALDQTQASAVGTRAQVSYDLRSAFTELLYAQEWVRLLEQIEQRRADNLELVDLRYEGGREHKGSLALSQASLFDADTQVKQARRLVEVNRQVLERVMGWSSDSPSMAVTGSLASVRVSTRKELETLARETPEYREAEAALESARIQVDSARSGFLPQINLSGSAGRSGDDDAFDDDQWAVGVNLSFPLWPGGRNTHEWRKALAGVVEAEANLAAVLDRQARALTESQKSLADAVENVAVQNEYVEAAELRATIARRQYEDGILSFENWSIIEDDRISRQQQFLNAERTALRSEAAWWLAVGRDVFTEGEGVR